MKIRLIKIGRVKKELRQLIDEYQKKLLSFTKIELVEYKNSQIASKSLTELIHKQSSLLICFDEKGKQQTSKVFAQNISDFQSNPNIKYLNFIIGDPYGLPKEIKSLAHQMWGLSSLTFPSDLAWLLVLEQIYRAFNIMQGTPYHHD